MANIDIQRTHNLGLDEARVRVAQIEPELKSKYGVSLSWNGDRALVKGPGVSGDAWIDPTDLGMSLKLNLLLRPLAGKIKSAIEQAVDDALGR
jgi:putative polyhydroxyalkanoate system protein